MCYYIQYKAKEKRVFMDTNISKVIDVASDSAKYDASIKEMLADKQILARILKYTLEEFADLEIEDIIKDMSVPQVSSVRMEPGHTNTEKIQKTSEEDNVLGEGKIYYDIRFNAYIGTEMIKFLINIEAQKSTNSSKLGYHLDNRIIYYLGRMISAQKEVEFSKSSYDDLKAVRSIWICMYSADQEDSINRIRFTEETVFGKGLDLPNIDKVQGIIIRLRKNENVEKSKNKLIAMLEELLKKESVSEKKKKLCEEYGITMSEETERRLNTMCNLSEVVLERGIEEGIEQGIKQGIEQGQRQLIEKMLKKGKTAEEIADLCDISVEIVKEIEESIFE